MNLIVTWLLSALAVFITAYILPGVTVVGFLGALLVAAVLGLFNALIRPLLLILTLPINVLTLGLFTLVINAVIVLMVSAVVPQFRVGGFLNALLFAIVLAIVNWLVFRIFPA
jgi:putative membrane protein